MKFFEKLMIDEFLNEGDDLGDLEPAILKRMYYKKIMNSDKKGLDKLFKEFEKRQEQYKKRQRFGFSDKQIDLLKSWFGERAKQLGIKESYNFYLNENNKTQDYIKKIKNKDKKDYAQKYLKWKMSGEKGDSPDRGKLSVMGAQAVRMQLEDLFESVNESPIGAKGWTQASVEKFGKTIGKDPKEKGFFDACVMRMKGKDEFDEEKARGFCASIKDSAFGSPNWRGKDKSKEETQKDTKKDRFKKQLPKE